MQSTNSETLFNRAQKFIPGGVNSPARAFKAVGGNPLFIKKAKGPFVFDEDENRYIDLINSWGPMITGHADENSIEAVKKALSDSFSFGAPTKKEIDIAELIIEMVPSVEKVRLVNSGTEATMSAVRLARGFTGKDKIIKFEGCYHGHSDSFLIAAGSGAVTLGVPDSPGVTEGVARDTLTAPFNNLTAVEEIVAANQNQIAAVIIEPVAGNMGCVPPKEGFLESLRALCDKEGIILIFDEVMTGFRLARGGAQEVFNVIPDLTTLGKIVGGGFPVGAFGGKKEIMDQIAPQGPVYQAGTLSGNPIAVTAGLALLKHLNDNPSIYSKLENTTSRIVEGIKKNLQTMSLNYTVNRVGSMFTLFFTNQQVIDFETARSSNLELFSAYFQAMLKKGIYTAPSQFESLFVSAAITAELADEITAANFEALKTLTQPV